MALPLIAAGHHLEQARVRQPALRHQRDGVAVGADGALEIAGLAPHLTQLQPRVFGVRLRAHRVTPQPRLALPYAGV